MNLALLRRSFAEGFWQLVASALLLFAFTWLFIWLNSQLKLGLWTTFLELLPDFVHRMIGVSPAALVSPMGRLSLIFVHLVPLLVFVGWAVGRGSDVVSGGIERGTLELLLTVPVFRIQLLVIPTLITMLGILLLAGAMWSGIAVGLHVVDFAESAHWLKCWPGVANVAAMTFALSGIATLLSACDQNRWRCIWLTMGLFVLSIIIKLVGRMWEAGEFLLYTSFLTAFEPQQLILLPEAQVATTLRYCGILIGVGMACYLLATVVFVRRDIPVPR